MSTEQKSTTDEFTEQPSSMSPEKESDSPDSSESKEPGANEEPNQEPERKVWKFDTALPPGSLFGNKPGKIPSSEFHPYEGRVWPGYDKNKYQAAVREWGHKHLPTKTTGFQPSVTPSSAPPASKDNEAPKQAAPPQKPAEPPAKEPPPKAPPPKTPPPKDPSPPAAPQRQQEPTPIGLNHDYNERVREETIAFNNMRGLISDLIKDIHGIKEELDERYESLPPSEQQQKYVTSMQELENRIDTFEKAMDKYQILEIRGPWDVSKEVERALRDVLDFGGSTKAGLRDFLKEWNDFAGRDPKGIELENAKSTLGKWLKTVSLEMAQRSTRVINSIDSYAKAVHEDFDNLHQIVNEIGAQTTQLLGRKPVAQEDFKALKEGILTEVGALLKADDEKESKLRVEFLRDVQHTVDEATVQSLDQLKDQLSSLSKSLTDATNILDQLRKRPVVDHQLLQSILEKVQALEQRPDVSPQITKIQQEIASMKSRPDAGEENTTRWQRVSEGLELVKTIDPPALRDIQSQATQIMTAVNAIREEMKARPDHDYSEILKNIDALVEKANGREELISESLDKMNKALDEIKERPEIDNTAALKRMEEALDAIKNKPPSIDYSPQFTALSKSLEYKIAQEASEAQAGFEAIKAELGDIKNRPALNHDFAALNDNVEKLGRLLDSEQGSILSQLQNLQKSIRENALLNIPPEALWSNFNDIKTLIKAKPELDQAELFGLLRGIAAKTHTIDFPGVFTDLNRVNTALGILTNQKATSPEESQKIAQGLHNNIDLMRQALRDNPILSAGKPLATMEYIDNKLDTLTTRLGNLETTTDALDERSKLSYTVASNSNNHIQSLVGKKPDFDLTPMVREMEAMRTEDRAHRQTIAEVVGGIQRDDKYTKDQLLELNSGVKSLESQGNEGQANLDALSKKVDGLNKVVTGASLVAGGAAAAFGAIKLFQFLFGKKEGKKESGVQSAVNAKKVAAKPKKVEKRLHARAWTDHESQFLNAEIDDLDVEGVLELLMEMDAAEEVFQLD